jgi:methyltransferase (TIGR00027 family)
MKPGEPSRTAEHMALFRALESSRPKARLFEDPFAELFLRPPFRFVLRLSRVRPLRTLINHWIDHAGPGARSSGIARTRFIDDTLRAALDDGVQQIAILGAGFDCRAYRVPGMEQARVFEVDHPDTLREKQRRLGMVLSSAPRHVRFVETDFNHQQLATTMARSGYDARCRTCFIWEGVTNYLADAAIDSAFRWFATAAPGSVVIFTYVDRRVLREPEAFHGARRLLRRFRRIGEPWTFGFDPAELGAYLATRGLGLVEDVGAVEYRARYWGKRRDCLRGYEFYRVAVARVGAAVRRGGPTPCGS